MTALRAPEVVADAAVDARERRQGARCTLSYRGLARTWARMLLPERDEELARELLAALDDEDPFTRLRALAEALSQSPRSGA